MSDSSLYNYPSPLAGFENLPPLPEEKAADGKSYANPQTGILSKSYEEFVDPLDRGIRGALLVFPNILGFGAESLNRNLSLIKKLTRCFKATFTSTIFKRMRSRRSLLGNCGKG